MDIIRRTDLDQINQFVLGYRQKIKIEQPGLCGQLTEKRAFDGIFDHIKALCVFDAAHRAQNGTQIGTKRAQYAFVS